MARVMSTVVAISTAIIRIICCRFKPSQLHVTSCLVLQPGRNKGVAGAPS